MLVAEDFVFVAGLPPFDPVSGEVTRRPFEQQADLVLGQMKRCLEAVGSSMEQVVKCNIHCTDPAYYGSRFMGRFGEFLSFPPLRCGGLPPPQ